jgi:hypothetical protein
MENFFSSDIGVVLILVFLVGIFALALLWYIRDANSKNTSTGSNSINSPKTGSADTPINPTPPADPPTTLPRQSVAKIIWNYFSNGSCLVILSDGTQIRKKAKYCHTL